MVWGVEVADGVRGMRRAAGGRESKGGWDARLNVARWFGKEESDPLATRDRVRVPRILDEVQELGEA